MKCAMLWFFCSLVALITWIIHQFVLEFADHFTFPPAFWSTVFFTLFFACGIEGFFRWKNCREDEPVHEPEV